MTKARSVRLDLKRALAVTLVGLAGAVGALVFVLWLAGSSDAVDVKLGDPDFRGIDAGSWGAWSGVTWRSTCPSASGWPRGQSR